MPLRYLEPVPANILWQNQAIKKERMKGVEPSTATLATWCSTTELHPHNVRFENAVARNDNLIVSTALSAEGSELSTKNARRQPIGTQFKSELPRRGFDLYPRSGTIRLNACPQTQTVPVQALICAAERQLT